MDDVDAQLTADNVAMPAREITAFRLIAMRLQIDLKITPPKTELRPRSYEGDDLSIRIIEWMRARYGTRLNFDPSPGTRLIAVRGNLWALRLPLIFGTARLIAERNLRADHGPTLVTYSPENRAEPIVVNILRSIEELPQGLSDTLSVDECNSVMQGFVQGIRAFSGLERFRSDALAVHARRDLTQSSRFAMEGPAAYGQSRWSALQASEKSLKLFIEKKSVRYPMHHRLAELAAIASKLGLPEVPQGLLEAAQCDADVRYEYSDQRTEPVLAANAAAVAIAFMATSALLGGVTFSIERIFVDPAGMHSIVGNALPAHAIGTPRQASKRVVPKT